MTEKTETFQLLAMLLEAEATARRVSRAELLERLTRCRRFCPARAEYYAMLLRAAEKVPLGQVEYPEAIQRVTGQVREGLGSGVVPAGPVLLVCESKPFAPDLDNPIEQILVRLIGCLRELGVETWLLRLARRNRRLCDALMGELPGRPAGVVSVEVSHPGCMESLGKLGTMVQVGMKSVLMRRLACVEHDTALEAAEITSRAVDVRAEQVAFVGLIREVAGKRRIRAGDARLLSMMAMEAQNHHITLPGSLQMWADAGQSLEQAGVLERLMRQPLGRTLLVVASTRHAVEVARAVKDQGYAGLVCRHWAPGAGDTWPTVGQDLDRLASAGLMRLVRPGRLPMDMAVLVPPKWYRTAEGARG